MDSRGFDSLARALARHPSRRAVLWLTGAPFAASSIGVAPARARKKKKEKKTTLCLDGQTIQASKKKKKKLLKSGATQGACAPSPGCTPACAGTTCGGDDGCGGVCGCATGSLCHSGVCHSCDVSCQGDATTCGNELQAILNGGGTIYVCPGRYAGTFSLTAANVTLIGAGQGDDPATNTILDARKTDRVVDVSAGVSAALSGLRITGGRVTGAEYGGGVQNSGTLTMTACTVAGNEAVGGGGIFHFDNPTGPLTLNACTVSENKAQTRGGGILIGFVATARIFGSAITGNQGQEGGGLANAGTTTFDGASRVTDNTASVDGGGIYSFGGSVTLNQATVSGNTPNACVNVDGC